MPQFDLDPKPLMGFNALISDPVTISPVVEPELMPVPDPKFTKPDEILPAVEPTPDTFTGIRCYSDCRDCNPCRCLLADLQFLRDFHGWTLSFSADEPADWQFLPARKTDRQIPLIERWERGEKTGEIEGYDASETLDERRCSLKRLVNFHPSKLNR